MGFSTEARCDECLDFLDESDSIYCSNCYENSESNFFNIDDAKIKTLDFLVERLTDLVTFFEGQEAEIRETAIKLIVEYKKIRND